MGEQQQGAKQQGDTEKAGVVCFDEGDVGESIMCDVFASATCFYIYYLTLTTPQARIHCLSDSTHSSSESWK